MQLVEAYNVCLSAIGQAAVANLDVYDPDVAEIENHVNRAKRQVLHTGYLFNTDKVTLSPANDANRVLVSGYLRVPGLADKGLTVREGYVWNPSLSVYHAEALPDMLVIVDLDWDNLPVEFQDWIAHRAAVSFLLQVKGPTADLSYWQRLELAKAAVAENLYPSTLDSAMGLDRLKGAYWA